jgi:hypothetical protein
MIGAPQPDLARNGMVIVNLLDGWYNIRFGS